MKKSFAMYGDTVSFDLSFNMIKNIHESGKKWKVGFFVGTSSNKHIVPFAIVVMLH